MPLIWRHAVRQWAQLTNDKTAQGRFSIDRGRTCLYRILATSDSQYGQTVCAIIHLTAWDGIWRTCPSIHTWRGREPARNQKEEIGRGASADVILLYFSQLHHCIGSIDLTVIDIAQPATMTLKMKNRIVISASMPLSFKLLSHQMVSYCTFTELWKV